MKTLKIGVVLITAILLAGPPLFARNVAGPETMDRVENGQTSNEQNLQLLMEENDSMMQMMHRMMDRFKTMDAASQGNPEMEAMMQEMARIRTNHQMQMAAQENLQMMALMHKAMGHLKEMNKGEEGKREMGKMMDQMGLMRTHHQTMMDR